MLELMVNGMSIDVYCKKEISLFSPPPRLPANTVYCTKQPAECRVVIDLLECNPDLWFIFMVRDPRDVVVSIHKRSPNQYWTNLRAWRTCWEAIQQHTDHERLIIVKYEELVRTPDQSQERLLARMPFLQKRNPFSEFHLTARPSEQSTTAMHGIRPVNDSSIGSWRKHKARLAGQIKLHGPIMEELIRLDYEKDDAWLAELDGIEPDTRPGFWPDFIPKDVEQQRRITQQQQIEQYRRRRAAINRGKAQP